jgi:hypothetical protein
MANYSEEILEGNTVAWTRSPRIVIDNPYGGVPSISFTEERKAQLPNGEIVVLPLTKTRNITEAFTDPNKVINLVHPVTGESLGTSTYMNLQVLLCSLYHQLATERDAYVEPEPEPVE